MVRRFAFSVSRRGEGRADVYGKTVARASLKESVEERQKPFVIRQKTAQGIYLFGFLKEVYESDPVNLKQSNVIAKRGASDLRWMLSIP